jgi:Amt family ammonium transporter
MGIDTGDTSFILVSAALVLFMTPGLALFYGGMVRAKNVLSTMMLSVFLMGLVTVLWVVIGFTLAFGSADWSLGWLIGDLQYLGFDGVIDETLDTIPLSAFAMFQLMFAIITPALITGAFAERIKFSAYIILMAVWSIVVYAPLAHWVWGGGWIGEMGALDFAGGTVVHISSAAAALACAIVVGKRKDFGTDKIVPHNLTLTLLGAGILWFGWFGFNAGSALAANASASTAFTVTQISAASGLLAWLLVEKWHSGKPTTLGAASGAVAGLVAITPASGFVSPLAAIVIGLTAGALCYGGIMLKSRFGYDDALDVVGIHGVGGTVGALLTGVFAVEAIGGTAGVLEGNWSIMGPQVISIVATIAFSFIVTFVVLKVLQVTIGVRVEDDEEETGLDLSEHAETGYSLQS